MKPGKGDHTHSIRITGTELAALKEPCLDLPESFGLDRRIAAYKGTRAIGFYRWDLGCLVDVLSFELDPRTAVRRARLPIKPNEREALQTLFERLKALREEAYWAIGFPNV